MGPIGIPELILVLVVLLVIFGPKRLPGLGRSLGSGMREFKDSVSGDKKPEPRSELPPPLPTAPAPVADAEDVEATPVAAPVSPEPERERENEPPAAASA
jgi:sec-independent protein translocase protein TatA